MPGRREAPAPAKPLPPGSVPLRSVLLVGDDEGLRRRR